MLRKKVINKTNNTVNFLNILKAIKEDRKLTIEQLAKEFGVSRQLMNGYFTGRWDIPAPAIFAGVLLNHPDLVDAMHAHIVKKNTGGTTNE